MYIFYSGPNNCYASAGVSKRSGSDTSVDAIYLGRVLDREAGIYKSRERGIFSFNPETGEFGSVPADFVPPETVDRRKKHRKVSVDFGDAFFMNGYLHMFWGYIFKGYKRPNCFRFLGTVLLYGTLFYIYSWK